MALNKFFTWLGTEREDEEMTQIELMISGVCNIIDGFVLVFSFGLIGSHFEYEYTAYIFKQYIKKLEEKRSTVKPE